MATEIIIKTSKRVIPIALCLASGLIDDYLMNKKVTKMVDATLNKLISEGKLKIVDEALDKMES